MTTLTGWHPGELEIQRLLGVAQYVTNSWTWIAGEMPEEHRKFFTTRLPFIPVTTLDGDGRPWGSILAGEGERSAWKANDDGPKRNGDDTWVESGGYNRLALRARVCVGDPVVRNVKAWKEKAKVGGDGERMLIAGIGVEFSTRRRNKFAGFVESVDHSETSDEYTFHAVINEAIGNCPKYITVRDLVSVADEIHPHTIHDVPILEPSAPLPDSVIAFIHGADTVFLGSTYVPDPASRSRHAPHLGMNHRGGRPGFVRVLPSTRRTLVLPDYSGNRLLTSLGNIHSTPLASLTIPDFKTGDILYLTGTARNCVGDEARRFVDSPGQGGGALTVLEVTGYAFVQDALPVRQRPGTEATPSPYSPPVRYLTEEMKVQPEYFGDIRKVILTEIDVHASDLASFTFEGDLASLDAAGETGIHANPQPLPGQHVIMTLAPLLGAKRYAHMAPLSPASLNDDRIRSWSLVGWSGWNTGDAKTTVPLKNQTSSKTYTYTLTIRNTGGTATSALFGIARAILGARPDLVQVKTSPINTGTKTNSHMQTTSHIAVRVLSIELGLLGFGGEFLLDSDDGGGSRGELRVGDTRKLLFIAGGIGITPFLGMMRGSGAGATSNDLAAATADVSSDAAPTSAAFNTSSSLLPPSPTLRPSYDVLLVMSTREPEKLVPLVLQAWRDGMGGGLNEESGGANEHKSKLEVHVFLGQHGGDFDMEGEARDGGADDSSPNVRIVYHRGRIGPGVFVGPSPAAHLSSDLGSLSLESQSPLWSSTHTFSSRDLRSRTPYICGPPEFEAGVMTALGEVGIGAESVRRE
ncbi:hypothetical protein BJ138DRAFT_1175007, partial [Hygrophoropsis aurantiaca]